MHGTLTISENVGRHSGSLCQQSNITCTSRARMRTQHRLIRDQFHSLLRLARQHSMKGTWCICMDASAGRGSRYPSTTLSTTSALLGGERGAAHIRKRRVRRAAEHPQLPQRDGKRPHVGLGGEAGVGDDLGRGPLDGELGPLRRRVLVVHNKPAVSVYRTAQTSPDRSPPLSQ